jgi:hypothetical protein
MSSRNDILIVQGRVGPIMRTLSPPAMVDGSCEERDCPDHCIFFASAKATRANETHPRFSYESVLGVAFPVAASCLLDPLATLPRTFFCYLRSRVSRAWLCLQTITQTAKADKR